MPATVTSTLGQVCGMTTSPLCIAVILCYEQGHPSSLKTKTKKNLQDHNYPDEEAVTSGEVGPGTTE